ncbi:hypothetical protein Esti_001075 [Eimeria stiedai]
MAQALYFPWTPLRAAPRTGVASAAASSARRAAGAAGKVSAISYPVIGGKGAPSSVSSPPRWPGCKGVPPLLPAASQYAQRGQHVAGTACMHSLPLKPDARSQEKEGTDSLPTRVTGDAGEGQLPVVRRVLEAASDGAPPNGKSFWASQREEAARCVEEGQVSSSVAALLVAAFARAGELTAPLATAVGTRFAASLRDTRRKALTLPLLGDETADQRPARGVRTPVNFSAVATLFLAKREAGILTHPSVAPVAVDLHRELLLCVQPQWDSLAFAQLRRMWLLLGVTAESLGLHVGEARALLTASKKRLRRMQKKGYLCEGADARDSAALLWPLAAVSAVTRLPFPPEDLGGKPIYPRALEGPSCAGTADSGSSEELSCLIRDRDIVLQLLVASLSTALSSRLPCSPLDLALAYAGLDRLAQRRVGERVLVAFGAAAAAASIEELCRLGRDLLLTGRLPRALWAAFGDAAADALQQHNERIGKQLSSEEHHHAAELTQWLRLCRSMS